MLCFELLAFMDVHGLTVRAQENKCRIWVGCLQMVSERKGSGTEIYTVEMGMRSHHGLIDLGLFLAARQASIRTSGATHYRRHLSWSDYTKALH